MSFSPHFNPGLPLQLLHEVTPSPSIYSFHHLHNFLLPSQPWIWGWDGSCKFLALLSIKALNNLCNISPVEHLLGDQKIIPGVFYLAVKMPQSSWLVEVSLQAKTCWQQGQTLTFPLSAEMASLCWVFCRQGWTSTRHSSESLFGGRKTKQNPESFTEFLFHSWDRLTLC